MRPSSLFRLLEKWCILPGVLGAVVLAGVLGMNACSGPSAPAAREQARQLLESKSFVRPPVVDSTADEARFRRMAGLAFKANRKRPYVLRKLVQHYRDREKWDQALGRLNQLIELQPLDPRWYLQRGQILGQGSESDERQRRSMQSFRTAIQLGEEPYSTVTLQARYGLGLLLAFRSEQVEQGSRQLRRVLEARETVKNRMVQKKARFALGRLAFENGDWNRARDHFRNAALMEGVSSSSRARALENLARTLRKLQRGPQAKSVRRMARNVKRRQLSLQTLERRLETLNE